MLALTSYLHFTYNQVFPAYKLSGAVHYASKRLLQSSISNDFNKGSWIPTIQLYWTDENATINRKQFAKNQHF